MSNATPGTFHIADLYPTRVNPGAPEAFSGAIFDLDGTLVDSMDYWDTLGPNFLNDPCQLSDEDCVAIYQKSYK